VHGHQSTSVVYIFVFLGNIIVCQLYKLALTDPAQVTLQLRVILSDLVFRYIVGLPLLEGIFHQGPNPVSAALLITNPLQ